MTFRFVEFSLILAEFFVYIVSSQELTQITHETLKNNIKFRMIISAVVIFDPFGILECFSIRSIFERSMPFFAFVPQFLAHTKAYFRCFSIKTYRY